MATAEGTHYAISSNSESLFSLEHHAEFCEDLALFSSRVHYGTREPSVKIGEARNRHVYISKLVNTYCTPNTHIIAN